MSGIKKSQWVESLRDFSYRNASRRARIEFDRSGAGRDVRAVADRLSLRGVAYDPRDDRIEIMVGPLLGTAGHLTHSICSPTSIDLVSDEEGADEALWVEERDGGTLLTLL